MKRYDQYCPIACTLSVVGERWTLLVVRELLYGPKRYTDLAAGLPGIGTNILADRLKELESAGLVERRKLPPPAASTVYELTAAGLGLRPVLHELARFGARLMGPPAEGSLEEGWLAHALDLVVAPVPATGRVAFRIGGEEVSVVEGEVVAGVVDDPDTLVEGSATGFYRLVVERDPTGVTVTGEQDALERLLDGFTPPVPEPLPA